MKIHLLSTSIIFITGSSTLLFPKIYNDRARFAHNIPSHFSAYPSFNDFYISIIIAMIYICSQLLLSKPFMYIGNFIVEKKDKWSKKERLERIERFANVIFKLCHYIFICTYTCIYFSKSNFFITSLGGNGNIENIFDGWPYQPILKGQKLYYLIQLGYHLQAIFLQLIKKRRNNFLEMIVHDLCTIFMVSISYLYNLQYIGILVSFLHDISDIPVHITKSLVDSSYTTYTLVSYLLMCITWVYTRLYIFPTEIIWIGINFEENYKLKTYLVSFAICLQCLHIYWFGLFIKMGYRFLKKGIAEDIIQKIENKEKK